MQFRKNFYRYIFNIYTLMKAKIMTSLRCIMISDFLKTFKDSFYSSEKLFFFDNCGFWVCEIKVFLWNLAIVSDGKLTPATKSDRF